MELLETLSGLLWGTPMLVALLGCGLWLSLRTSFLPLRRLPWWLKKTLFTRRRRDKRDETADSLSPFQALTTALASTIGTGNIVGVAAALTAGGPGALFWMWASALLGMSTKYAEIVLTIHFRRRDSRGQWMGGPMIYLEQLPGPRVLPRLFALFCLLSSLCMGNLSQTSALAESLWTAFSLPPWICVLLCAALLGAIFLGGVRRLGSVTAFLVPIMSAAYLLAGAFLLLLHADRIPDALGQIFAGAFDLTSVGGGVAGYGISRAMRVGLARGVFSNEAGLGSSSLAHSAARTNSAVEQGFWGIVEIFVDTILICTMTGLVILTSGLPLADYGSRAAALTIAAFAQGFGPAAGTLLSVAITLFALSTLIGWSYYGQQCMHYLCGPGHVRSYQAIFLLTILLGAGIRSESVWLLSDLCNGLMAVPNLIGVIALSGTVARLTHARFPTKKRRPGR